MAGFDTKEMMNRAIRYMAQTAMERAAGGWVPPKERERQQKEAMRAEEKQARQAEKQHKEANRAHEKEQKLLSKQFPTQYMPNVGRQVMQDGGVPDDRNQVGLYSKAARTVAALPQKKATGAQMVAALRDPKRGVKKEELINAGLMLPSEEVHPDWANRSVTTDELAQHFNEQMPKVEEKIYSGDDPDSALRRYGRFEKLVMPNGENHREILLKLPRKKTAVPEIMYKTGEDIRAKINDFARLGYSPETVQAAASFVDQFGSVENGLRKQDALIARGYGYTPEQKDAGEILRGIIRGHEKKVSQALAEDSKKLFSTGHYPKDANVLAHIRMSDRTGPNGEKILHVEEIQSDWGQKGRDSGFGLAPEEQELFDKTQNRLRELRSREAQIIMDELEDRPINKQEKQNIYTERQKLERVFSALELRQDASVPKAPYVQSTEGWTDLALKRIMKEAAEGGYDKIVWTPGVEQGKRYDLTKHVGRINYEPFDDDGKKLHQLEVFNPSGEKIFEHEGLDAAGLKEHVGKDLAKKIMDDAGKPMEDRPLRDWRSLSGLDLKVGDEGMREYYDRIVPSRMTALAKKHDPSAKVSTSMIKTHGDEWPLSARIAHDGEKYWVSGKSPYEDSPNEVQLTPKVGSYEEADNHRNLLYSGYNQPVHSMDVTPQMRESVMKGQEAYAHGGEVDGYANGGSPSLSQRILDYAETLPTAEENIETIKKFGRNVGEGAADIGKRVFSGFEKMAERALDRSPPPTVRAGERPVYVEPKREEPPQRLYVLPDGRRVSGAELEMHNEMMRERFEEQYAMPRVVQENMPPQNRPVPTRAPMRERLERQEQQANVNRPVVLPERKGFDFPQVYKDIMSDEPQMEWTKGMTPREQAAPVKTAEGSIFASRGNDGSKANASGPLEVSVTKTITGPKDVYLGTGDTPNPFHSHQTMVAPAPEYEGQVVPIPDTPADRMGEHHLPRLIWPIHELKNKEGYKAKQGLEDYNPPASAIGERFPTKEDVDFYRSVDANYGRPEAGYLQQGARGSFYDDLTNMTSRQGGYRRDMTPQESDAFNAAYIAAQRNPIAALGFRPEEFDFSGSPIPQTTAGMVSSPQSRIYADLKFPSVAVHEAIHRGLMEIRNKDYNAYLQKTGNLLQEMNDLAKQPYSSEKSKRFFEISDELDALRKQPTDPDIFQPGQIGDAEGKEDEQEMFVRSLMYKMFGPVEAYEMERQLVNGDVIKEYPQEKLERFMSDNADRVTRLEQRAMKMLQERQRAAGPRASGGKVERQGLASGGSPDDDMIRDALSRVASPFSDNPELAAKAVEIANRLYKIPQGTETEGSSYYGFKGKDPIPVSDVQATVEPIPGVTPLEPNPMSWEDFYKVGKGGTMINLGGDRSRLGRLTHINGKKLGWPVDLHAGPEYMLEPNPGAVWANADNQTKAIRNKILEAAEKGPVYGVYTPMGPETVDASHHMFDALMSQIAADPPSKKVAKQVDDSLVKGKFIMGNRPDDVKDREKAIEYMQGWPGILNAKEASAFAKNLPSTIRSRIVKHLDKDAWYKIGLPHVGRTRVAITNPDLVAAPANMMGYRIAELSPEKVTESAFKHGSYQSPTAGTYKADVPLVQRQYAVPDVMDQFLSTRAGKGDIIMHPYSLQPGGRNAFRKMLDEQKHFQPINQRMLDSIQQGLERQSKYGLKDGGKVEDRNEYAIGGNPGDIAGGGFGTGNVGGGSSISSGGSMAEARAADRASVSGYSADSGGGSSWSGGGGDGGGGRDSSPSIDRSTSGGDGGRDFSIGGPQGLTGAPAFGRPEQGTDTYNLDNRPPMTVGARFSPNIGADLVKEAVTPDFSTGNSPLASGVSSYDQNAINALYDRMRAEQQAERNESYERSVVGPTTPQINVPNAGDLYGATDAPLAVNQKPSGMFGQPEFGTTRFGQTPMQSGFPKQSDIETRASGPFSQPNRPITPTPFSGYPQEVQNALNPVKPDSAFGQTLIDPTGKYTNQALDQMGVATDALTMLNSPTLAGAFVRAFTPTPTPATAQQQAAIERMYRRDLNTGVPANFATPEGMAQRYGAPGAMPLPRPGQTSTAYLSAGPSASTGRQDMPIGATSANQTPRENFEQAFAAARARGEQTFSWTNPATGQTMLYTTQLGRKQGGRVPSLKEPEQWECKEKR